MVARIDDQQVHGRLFGQIPIDDFNTGTSRLMNSI